MTEQPANRTEAERALDAAFEHADRAYMAVRPFQFSDNPALKDLYYQAFTLRAAIGAAAL